MKKVIPFLYLLIKLWAHLKGGRDENKNYGIICCGIYYINWL